MINYSEKLKRDVSAFHKAEELSNKISPLTKTNDVIQELMKRIHLLLQVSEGLL